MKTIFVLLLLVLVVAAPHSVAETSQAKVSLLASDPVAEVNIGLGDKLYLRLAYDSPVPVRFQVEALRDEVPQEKAFAATTPPYDAGRGEAMTWIGFPVPVHIDAVRVTAYDYEWREIGTVTAPLNIRWSEHATGEVRHLAEWVGPLMKQQRIVFDTHFDPQPEKPELLFNLLLVVSLVSVPFYLLLQLQLLLRLRGEWRTYALAPLLAIFPLCLYSLIGLGLQLNHWVIFLFRFFPISCLYLGALWLAHWYCELRNPPFAP